MPASPKPISSLRWVFISLVGFILFLGAAILFSLYADKLSRLNSTAYFFLLVILGLVAAGFLSGGLRSYAKYKGKLAGGVLQLSGPVVIFFIILYVGYKYRPQPVVSTFSLTVNVFGQGGEGNIINSGEVTIGFGNYRSTRPVNGEGQVIFPQLPPAQKGKSILLIPSVEGYEKEGQQHKIPEEDDPAINLGLVAKPDSMLVRGTVLNYSGEVISGAELDFNNGLAGATSDESGNFRVTLPLKEGSEVKLRVLLNGAVKYDEYKILSEDVSTDIIIRN